MDSRAEFPLLTRAGQVSECIPRTEVPHANSSLDEPELAVSLYIGTSTQRGLQGDLPLAGDWLLRSPLFPQPNAATRSTLLDTDIARQ
jgi:hypothetical protein